MTKTRVVKVGPEVPLESRRMQRRPAAQHTEQKVMPLTGRIRRQVSALVLWCVFLGLYLGGAVMLVMGLVLASQTWWAAVHQHAGFWLIGEKTAEVFILAVGLVLILIVPVCWRRSIGRSGAWRVGRRSEPKCRVPLAE